MSTSWIGTKYGDKFYLTEREWAGQGSPDYRRVFEIREEEEDLNAGRFSKFLGYYDGCNYYRWIDEKFDNIIKFKFISVPVKQYGDVIQWVLDNINEYWGMGITDGLNDTADFFFIFTDKKDAVNFKMTWN